MPLVKSKARVTKKSTEADLLSNATLRLVRAVKKRATKAGKPLKRGDLLKQGYGKRFVAKVEKA